MQLLFVIDTLNLGGGERACIDLARGLIKRGHDVTIHSFEPGPFVELTTDLKVVINHGFPIKKAGLHGFLAIMQEMRRKKYDLVIAFNVKPVWAVWVARLHGIPSILRIGGTYWAKDYPLRRLLFFKLTARIANKVIFVSDAVKDFWKLPGEVIINGVPPQEIKKKNNKKLKVGIIGRLVPVKRHDILLKAWKKVKGAELWIIGNGTERQKLEILAKELKLKNVKFCGEQDARKKLNDIDIFVMCSDSEGMPLAMLEAMSAGIPVITTPAGGIKEIIEDGKNGIIVPFRDPDKLAEAINKLLKNKQLRQRLSKEGRITTKQNYERILDQYERLIYTLTSAH